MTQVARRVGVVRSDAPHLLVAEAEARVICRELQRRLGPLTLDLRIEGEPVGRWLPREHAAWPADVDAVVDVADLVGPDAPPLTALFARTVAPESAEVRRRMLRHLGFIDGRPFDHAALAALDDLVPTPTDLWLLVSSAPTVSVADPAIRALAISDASQAAALDAALDRAAQRLLGERGVAAATERELARVLAELDDARRVADDLAATLARERIEAASVIDDLARRAAALELADRHDDTPA